MATPQRTLEPAPRTPPAVGGRYANYALGVLVLVYVFHLAQDEASRFARAEASRFARAEASRFARAGETDG